MYTVLTFKATRTPKLVVSGLDKPSAIVRASDLYDHAKILSDHAYLASGVTVVVMTDEEAQEAIESGTLPHLSKNRLVYQCGGY